jgi:hypothetical protein
MRIGRAVARDSPTARSARRPVSLKRIAAFPLLAAAIAGNFATHQHSFLASEDQAGLGEERAVTRHDPFSRASHWHAVLAFVHEHDCVACHHHRLAGLPVQGPDPAPAASSPSANPTPSAIALAAPRLSTSSRAPPILL